MNDYQDRIEVNPKILLGKPVVRGTRIPIYVILNLLAQGKPTDYILKEYPDLEKDDITASLQFAAQAVNFKEEFFDTGHA